jgi:hypothetical protein
VCSFRNLPEPQETSSLSSHSPAHLRHHEVRQPRLGDSALSAGRTGLARWSPPRCSVGLRLKALPSLHFDSECGCSPISWFAVAVATAAGENPPRNGEEEFLASQFAICFLLSNTIGNNNLRKCQLPQHCLPCSSRGRTTKSTLVNQRSLDEEEPRPG